MCERYVCIDTVEEIEKHFNAKVGFQLDKFYNLSPGQKAPVIICDDPFNLQLFKFGITPSGTKKELNIINARVEGDHNTDDNPNYRGAKGIIVKPAFRKLIRSQRCLVIASAFLAGPKDIGLSKPYLVYLQNKKKPFAMAGIYDSWINSEGEKIKGFAIITTTANELLLKIGQPRMPVILRQEDERTWLKKDAPLNSITCMLWPYLAELMNAYPIDPAIKETASNSRELINPIGQRVQPEYEFKVETRIEHHGLAHGKPRKKGGDEENSWGENRK